MEVSELRNVFVAGYWGPRGASAEKIAKTLFEWLDRLEHEHGSFGPWSAMAQPVTTCERLMGIVGMCFNPDEETGAPIESLGFSLRGESDPDGLPSAEFSVAAGATTPENPNSAVLSAPLGAPFPADWLPAVVPVIESIVECWKPRIVVFTSTPYGRALKTVMRGNWCKPGALTWLPVKPEEVPKVVEEQTVTAFASGALVSLMDGKNMPEPETVVSLAQGLLDAGLLDPQESDEAGETGA